MKIFRDKKIISARWRTFLEEPGFCKCPLFAPNSRIDIIDLKKSVSAPMTYKRATSNLGILAVFNFFVRMSENFSEIFVRSPRDFQQSFLREKLTTTTRLLGHKCPNGHFETCYQAGDDRIRMNSRRWLCVTWCCLLLLFQIQTRLEE